MVAMDTIFYYYSTGRSMVARFFLVYVREYCSSGVVLKIAILIPFETRQIKLEGDSCVCRYELLNLRLICKDLLTTLPQRPSNGVLAYTPRDCIVGEEQADQEAWAHPNQNSQQ